MLGAADLKRLKAEGISWRLSKNNETIFLKNGRMAILELQGDGKPESRSSIIGTRDWPPPESMGKKKKEREQ